MKILLAILTAPIYLDIMCHMVQFSFRLFCYGPSSARNYPNYRSLFEIFTRLWHRLNRRRERHGNPGPGGWGAVLRYGAHERELSGGEAQTTNNRMELTAVIEALRLLKEPCEVELYSDSKYVIDALSKGWVYGWQKKGWVKSDKKPALNVDLWERLLPLIAAHDVRYHWVKGHAENEYNNRCDELAVAESRKYK